MKRIESGNQRTGRFFRFGSLSIGVPMLGDHAVLHAEHVEPKRLMVLTVLSRPRLTDIDDDHVVVADHIQVSRQSVRETRP